MMWARRPLVLLLTLAASLLQTAAKSSTGSSVLVVLESQLSQQNYSFFFDGLEKRGYDLTFRAPKAETPLIMEDDIPSFSHVILFAPTTKSYAPDITPQSLVTLISQGVNILFAYSDTQTPLTSLATEFSLIPAPPHTPLISHFPEREPPYTIVPIQPPAISDAHTPILSPGLGPIWFSGAPHALGLNPYLVPILHAPPESFAGDAESDNGADALADASDKGGEGLWAGSQMSVVTGFQARGGARALWVGSVEVFSDEFAEREVLKNVKSGNAQFSQDVAAWTLQESLVLRIDSATHHRVNETEPPEMYTVNDQIIYTASISKWNSAASTWVPYSGITDLQLEFTMLDPHIRTALLPVRGKPGKYSVTFRAPDRHGVFKFVIDYKRKGWTHLYDAITVPVVPPRHDGYPRFLSAAWPYYVGAISTSVGFVIFSALWLAGDAGELDKSLKKSNKGEKVE